MPKNIGFIYKLEHKTRTDTPVYIGSTSGTLEDRFKQHGYSCNNSNHRKYNYYVYQFIRDYGNIEKWKITKLNECIYNERKELHSLERIFMEKYEKEGFKLLNKFVPCRTTKEWREDNKDKADLILMRSRLKNREKQNEYRRLHYHKNKDRILQQNKEYYIANKEKVDKARSQKWTCICGCELSLRQRTRHLQTKNHHDKLLEVFKDI